MTMLPEGMRPSLYVRDDDYRLSFLQGNFVTLTNMTTTDVDRVIEQRLSPLNVSLHAITSEIRLQLMGKNHARGMEVLEQLLAAGIEIQVQIVLVPGINGGEELEATLSWIEQREGITSVGIVPYGYTRYAAMQGSYETPDEALKVLKVIANYQERARSTMDSTRFMASDEFYLQAYPNSLIEHLPSADEYDGYPQYEDGIGMLRAFIDEWQICSCHFEHIVIATGTAFAPVLRELLKGANVEVRAIKNNFFGGNVDVAGLITERDLIDQLQDLTSATRLVISDVMLNDDGLFLDNLTPDDLSQALNIQVDVVSCSASALVEYLQGLYSVE